jgi:hypothetical protein
MAFVNRQDTDGSKGTLLKGELGLDLTVGADTYGYVYVGDGTNNIQVSSPKTVTPSIAIVSSVNEGSTATGTISNYDSKATYTISATNGTIAYGSGNTFQYTAPDVTDGDDDTDIVTAYATKAGETRSDIYTKSITVVYVPVVADSAVTFDLTTNELYNDGWSA